MFAALKEHWPEYLMEAAGLGICMMSVCVFSALLHHDNDKRCIFHHGYDKGMIREA
jgi:hypothetical protein